MTIVRDCVIYCRISEDREGAGLGARRQEDDGRRVADRLGWRVVAVFVDNDLTAYDESDRYKGRPDYERMCEMLRHDRRTPPLGIITWHTDRIQKSMRDLEDLIDLCDRGEHPVQTWAAGPLDLSTPSGRMVARVHTAIGRHESEHKAQRHRSKHLQLANDGQVSGGGHRPFGYADDRMTIMPDEADLIRDAARRILAGEAISAVVEDWNRRGLRTTVGGQWGVLTLKRVLISARISGRREHRPRARRDQKRPLLGEITATAVWPPIITVAESDRLRVKLTDPNRRISPGVNGRYPLSGLLRCSRCEQRMVGRPRGDKARRYVCDGSPGRPGCGRMFVLSEPTEELIRVWISDAFASEEFRQALRHADSTPDADDVVERIAKEQRELDQLAEDHGHRRITRSEWLAARAPIEERITQLRRVLARTEYARVLEGIPVDYESIYAAALAPERLRVWAAAAFHQITVHPAVRGRNRFDPDRFDPEWRA